MGIKLITLQFMLRSIEFYNKFTNVVAKKYHLTNVECSIILFLYKNPDKNTATEIVAHRMIKKSNVSTAISSLVQRGYISTSPDQEQRRVVRLFLEDCTKDIAIELFDRQIEFKDIYFDGFSKEEHEQYLHLINKINNNVTNALKNLN